MYAAQSKFFDVAEMLLRAGADPNTQDVVRMNPQILQLLQNLRAIFLNLEHLKFISLIFVVC